MKIDLDIRIFRRYSKEFPCSIIVNNRTYPAKTLSYSLNGVNIMIDDQPQVQSGDLLTVVIPELSIHSDAKVVWEKKLAQSLNIGVQLLGDLNGSFQHYRISDVLMGLQRTLMTGVLTIELGDILKKIYIINGTIVFAASNLDEEDLGFVLMREGSINKKQYILSREIREKTDEPYHQILADLNLIKREDTRRYIELQVRQIIESLFCMTDGRFTFVVGSFSLNTDCMLKLSAAGLIYREMKKSADVSELRKYLLDCIVDFSSTPLNLFQNVCFEKEDQSLLGYIDGRCTVRQLIALTGSSEKDVLRSVYALLETRILEIKDSDAPPSGVSAAHVSADDEQPDILMKRIEAMLNKYHSLSYYEVLGIGRDAPYEDVKKSYYRLAKSYHPDLHFRLEADMKTKLTEIFTYLTNAYLTLRNPVSRKKYDSCLKDLHESDTTSVPHEQCVHSDEERLAKNAEIARMKFQEGRDMFDQSKHDVASKLFAMAIYFDRSVPEYHFYYGCAFRKLGQYKEAVSSLNTALSMKPKEPNILAELGHVYLKLGYPKRAKGLFERAMSLEPGNKRALKGIDIMRAEGLFDKITGQEES